jgi:hypothetical protein
LTSDSGYLEKSDSILLLKLTLVFGVRVQLTIDNNTDSLTDALVALGHLYGVTLTVDSAAPAKKAAAKTTAAKKTAAKAPAKRAAAKKAPAIKAPAKKAVAKKAVAKKAPARKASKGGASASDVRAWAATRPGMSISARGRISADITKAYLDAHK